MTLLEVCKAIDTAFHWHGGGHKPLYGFASNRRIGSDDHRWGLIREIRQCMTETDSIAEHNRLEALHALVIATAIDHEVCTFADMTAYWNRKGNADAEA